MKLNRFLLLVLLCTILLFISTTIYANSAEPPAIVILINNPPDDLEIKMISNEFEHEAKIRKVAWEGYFAFYSKDIKVDNNIIYRFKITTDDNSFECTYNGPVTWYRQVLTLDMSTQKLTAGKYHLRSILLVTIRVLSTLAIEGIIFWLFRFRKKRSWIMFILVNLFTQGMLNIWLNTSSGSIFPRYDLIIMLIVGELFVFTSEIILLPKLINEHKKSVVTTFAVIANLVSLIAGGYLISILPV